MSLGDVGQFHRLARAYDLFMPSADPAPIEVGLELAERDLTRVVDVGGGTGRAVRSLAVAEPVVVDAARGMLRQARRRGLSAVQADAARLPLRDRSVDAVLVVDALHHVGDPAGAIAEAARVLRPGGVLVVREFDPSTRRGRLLAGVEHLVGFDSAFFTPADLARLAREAGLEASVPARGFGFTVAGVSR